MDRFGKIERRNPMWRRTYLDGKLRELRQQHKVRLVGGRPVDSQHRKRARGPDDQDESTTDPARSGTGLPPATDEPGSARDNVNTSQTGTGETPSSSDRRGGKRGNGGDDSEGFDFERQEDRDQQASAAPASTASSSRDAAPEQPADMDQERVAGHKRSIEHPSGSRHGDEARYDFERQEDRESAAAASSSVNSLQTKNARWNDDENAAMDENTSGAPLPNARNVTPATLYEILSWWSQQRACGTAATNTGAR